MPPPPRSLTGGAHRPRRAPSGGGRDAAIGGWGRRRGLCVAPPLRSRSRPRPGAFRLVLCSDLRLFLVGLYGECRRKRLRCPPPRCRQPWRLRCLAEELHSRCRGEVEAGSAHGVPCLETLRRPPHWVLPPTHGEWRAGRREESRPRVHSATECVSCTKTMIRRRPPQGMRGEREGAVGRGTGD